MSRDIATILRNQKKRRLTGESDAQLDFVLTSLLQDLLQEEISDYLDKVKSKLEMELAELQKQKGLLSREKNALLNTVNKKITEVKDGYTPIKGKDYFDGKSADEEKILNNVLARIEKPKDGKDADEDSIFNKLLAKIPKPEDGDDGKDGSPDNPEQIADKINTLEEKIEIKSIKGLKNYFDNIIRKMQDIKSNNAGKGGGMGNVEHKTFNVGSTTASSNIGSNVAAGGNAIWVYYQGQFLVKGTHYTISGSIITWSETFDDNTFVDITYIRT